LWTCLSHLKMSPHYLVKCRTHSSDGRYIVSLLTLMAPKRWVVLRGTGGCEKRRLCCVATWTSGKKRHSKCSKWPPSAWIHASSLFHHWLITSSTRLWLNSAHVSTSRCRILCISRIGNQPGLGQDCWLVTCQDWWTAVSHSAETRLCHGARCAGASPWRKTNTSLAMLQIAVSRSCISNTSR